MRALAALAESGLRSLWAYRLRTTVILLALVSIQTPLLTGLALTQGLLDQAQTSIDAGADLILSATSAGREALLPLSVRERVRDLPGVDQAVPRLVGSATLGSAKIEAVVVGVDPGPMSEALECVDGRWYREGPTSEIVIGRDLANRLGVRVGDILPPFYNNRRGDRLVKVVGIFRSEMSLWQSRLILSSFATATRFLDIEDACTDVLVYTRAGYVERLERRLSNRDLTEGAKPSLRLRVQSKESARRLLPAGASVRQTALSVFMLPALALGGAVVLLASGLGDSERRREIGVLKALGWQTDQVLIRGAIESLTLSFLAAATSLCLTYAWLRLVNGAGIAAMVFPATDFWPAYRVPGRLPAAAMIVAFASSTALVLVPSLGSQWRTALADPREAMR